MIVERRSPVTGRINSMDLPVTEEQIQAWRDGGLIQKVMPHLSGTEREFLMTGMTEEEWTSMFGEDDGLEGEE